MSRLMTLLASLLLALPAAARDTTLHLPIKPALDAALASGKLDSGVKFYFADQTHPAAKQQLGTFVTNRKTNAFGKSDEEACNWAMQSALIELQTRALKEGGNAVVKVESFYKKNAYRNETLFECHAGAVVAGVALRGSVIKTR